jgi:hypothetical protein
MVTANGKEDSVKAWRMTIVYAIIWFLVIKFAKLIVYTSYWKINCNTDFTWFLSFTSNWSKNCIERANIWSFAQIILDIINWMNSFVWLVVVIMIIYAWSQVLLSAWEEEKLTSAKKSLLYIAIWLLVLVSNFLILTFFYQEKPNFTILFDK